MNTNAVLMTEDIAEKIINSGLTRLLIGLDGYSKETYEKVRVGANFEVVKKNIEKLIEIKRKMKSELPLIRMSFVITELNKHEVDEFYNFWVDKVDYLALQEFVAPPVKNKTIESHKKIIENYDCDQPWNRLTIRSNGDVHPCCAFWGYYIPIGNANDSNIKSLWHSHPMKNLRDSFEKQNISNTCKKCLESN